jgi:hypothetical protein
MSKAKIIYPLQESVTSDHRHLLCWKSTLGGVLVALMIFITLTALGAGIAGFTAEALIAKEAGASALATGAGLYLGLAIVIALFSGSFFAMRISRFVTANVGAAHGFVIASVFFLLMLLGLGNAIGGLASGFGGIAKASGNGIADMASNANVQDIFNQTFGSSSLKNDPKDVAQGLTARLLQGDTESAKNYMAYQTGLSRSDVDIKIAELKIQFDAATKSIAEKTSRAVGDTGISFFVIFLVGLIGAVVGGRVGSHSNFERPFSRSAAKVSSVFSPLVSEQGSVVPYIFGWLLGVPFSILLLIAMFRSIF